MQSIRWLAILTASIIITACFFTWVSVESKGFFVGGFYSSANSRFGKPGILHTIFCGIYILLLLLNKVWSIRTAFFLLPVSILPGPFEIMLSFLPVAGEHALKNTPVFLRFLLDRCCWLSSPRLFG